MKNVTTTKPMSIEEIQINAKKVGFIPVTYTRGEEQFLKMVHCKGCGKDRALALRVEQKGGKYHSAHACPCGYREFYGTGPDKKKAPVEPTPEPEDSVSADEVIEENKPEVKICNRKKCNNPVPPGRTAVCFECRPKHFPVSM